MRSILLKRIANNDDGVFGVLVEGGVPLGIWTLERPWRDNEKNVSSIPAGSYLVRKVQTQNHGIAWQILQVPGRTGILLHAGNSETDSQGCVILGLNFGTSQATDPDTGEIETQPAVLHSRAAVEKFNEILGDDREFGIVIMWA